MIQHTRPSIGWCHRPRQTTNATTYRVLSILCIRAVGFDDTINLNIAHSRVSRREMSTVPLPPYAGTLSILAWMRLAAMNRDNSRSRNSTPTPNDAAMDAAVTDLYDSKNWAYALIRTSRKYHLAWPLRNRSLKTNGWISTGTTTHR